MDNADYEVLTRDNLFQIMGEAEKNWSGSFDTETAVRLGRLLGASIFIVGQVVYCGPSGGPFAPVGPGNSYDIFAVLQIIDPETGRVIMSSANEGSYLPGSEPLLFSRTFADYGLDGASTPNHRVPAVIRNNMRRVREYTGLEGWSLRLGNRARAQERSVTDYGDLRWPSSDVTESDADSNEKKVNYPAFKAAENLSNGFADKFFSRPTWEKIEMWETSYWKYGDILSYVKLGHCEMALDVFEEEAASEVEQMPAKDVAEYLHNYGVVLLCSNQPEKAMEKLRSAYRIGYEESTLRMLGLAAKSLEWSLHVEADQEPEVDLLVGR